MLSGSRIRWFIFACIVCMCAAQDNDLKGPPTFPTIAYTLTNYNSLGAIDSVKSTFFLDVYLYIAWVDERMADHVANNDNFDMDNWFWPNCELMNKRNILHMDWGFNYGLPSWLKNSTIPDIDPGATWIWAQARIIGNFHADLILQDFPSDFQSLPLRVESFIYNRSSVIFVPTPTAARDLITPDVEIPSWAQVTTYVYETPRLYSTFNNEIYSRVTFSVIAKRNSSYYMSRIVANVILLVTMAIFVTALKADETDRQMNMLAVVNAIVSWVFVLVAGSPQTSYLTRLDMFMNLSFVTIFLLQAYHAFNYLFFDFLIPRSNREFTKLRRLSIQNGTPVTISRKSSPLNTTTAPTPGFSPDEPDGPPPRDAASTSGHKHHSNSPPQGSPNAAVSPPDPHAVVAAAAAAAVALAEQEENANRAHSTESTSSAGASKSCRARFSLWYSRHVSTDRQLDVIVPLLIVVMYAVATITIFGRKSRHPVLTASGEIVE